MVSLQRWGRVALVTGSMIFAGAVHATPATYFGFDPSPQGQVSTEGDAYAARTEFLQAVSGGTLATETFESYAYQSVPTTLFSSTAALTLGDEAGRSRIGKETFDDSGNSSGRFNTTPDGQYFWETSRSFTLTFDTAINGFGFYATDVGDFNGVLTVTVNGLEYIVYDGRTVSTITGSDDNQVSTNADPDSTNGSLLFWGFSDLDTAFTEIVISISQPSGANSDALGFDDLLAVVTTTPPSDVPEPASLALASLALAGVAVTRRRRQG